VSPVWIAREDGYITFNTAVGRVKERNVRRDPRVAVSGRRQGRHFDALAKKYLGVDVYPGHNPDEPRVKVLVEPISVSR
jgi:hypothetical protein